MRLYLILFTVIAGFSACSKSSDYIVKQPDPTNPSVTGPVLTQMIQIDRGDSAVTTMSYDKEGRLAGEETSRKAIDQNGALRTYIQRSLYKRDEQGRVIQMILSTEAPGVPAYSEIYDHFYTGATSRQLSHTLRTYELSGSIVKDSTAYIYSASKISRIEHYQSEDDAAPRLLTYDELTYDARANIIKVVRSEDYAGSGTFQSYDIRADYDIKINPQFTQDDVFITQLNKYKSPNNLTKVSYGPESAVIKYEYRTDGRPVRSVVPATSLETVYVYSY
jgi:hypothetical protein